MEAGRHSYHFLLSCAVAAIKEILMIPQILNKSSPVLRKIDRSIVYYSAHFKFLHFIFTFLLLSCQAVQFNH